MSNTGVMTPEEIAAKYFNNAQWAIISMRVDENILNMTESVKGGFISNCAMWFFRNRDDFKQLITVMTELQNRTDLESRNDKNNTDVPLPM